MTPVEHAGHLVVWQRREPSPVAPDPVYGMEHMLIGFSDARRPVPEVVGYCIHCSMVIVFPVPPRADDRGDHLLLLERVRREPSCQEVQDLRVIREVMES